MPTENQSNESTQEAPKRKPVQRQVKVTLTLAEVDSRSKRLADANLEENALQAEKASAMASFNERLKDKREEIDRLAIAVKSGTEELEVDCYEQVDERRGLMLTLRSDNDEVIDERALTVEERQGELFQGGAGDANDEEEEDDDDGIVDDSYAGGAPAEVQAGADDKPKGRGRGRTAH